MINDPTASPQLRGHNLDLAILDELPPQPAFDRDLIARGLIRHVWGTALPNVYVQPYLYSPAFRVWLDHESESYLPRMSVIPRLLLNRETLELSQVFHTSAFLRSGATLTLFRQALGLNPSTLGALEISLQERPRLLDSIRREFREFQHRLIPLPWKSLNRAPLPSFVSASPFF